MSTWIPALHAGMTNREALLKVTGVPPAVFSKEAQSSQSSENCLVKNLFTLRSEPVLSNVEGRLRGAISAPHRSLKTQA